MAGRVKHLLATRDLFCCLAVSVVLGGGLRRRLALPVRLRCGVMVLDFGFLVAEACGV